MMHPNEALVERGTKDIPTMSPVEHFAGTEKFVKKAMKIQQERNGDFDITIDLEDGAPKGKEQDNLDMAIAMIKSDDNKFNRIGVRIHDPGNDWWFKEANYLREEVGDRLAYITLPKVLGAEDVIKMRTTLYRSGLSLHVIIETLEAFQNLDEILGVMNVDLVDFGLMDFTSAHQGILSRDVMQSPHQFTNPLMQYYKSQFVAKALAAGKVPAHNVTVDVGKKNLAYKDAATARNDFGFLRMWSVFPDQIDEIMRGMASAYNLLQLKAYSDILCKAQEADWGPIGYKGKMEDRATYRLYWQTLKRARSVTGVEIPEEAEERFFKDVKLVGA